MLSFKNNNTYCEIVNDEKNIDKYELHLIKELTVPSQQTINFNTGIKITLTEDYDKLFLKGEKIDDNSSTYFESDMFNKCEDERLVIQLTNPSDNDITFNKDFIISKLYKVFSDNGTIDVAFANGTHIYSDDNISVKSIDGETRGFTIETLPDGHRRLIVDID